MGWKQTKIHTGQNKRKQMDKKFYAALDFWVPERNEIGHYQINLTQDTALKLQWDHSWVAGHGAGLWWRVDSTPFANDRHSVSCVSMSPTVKPPP